MGRLGQLPGRERRSRRGRRVDAVPDVRRKNLADGMGHAGQRVAALAPRARRWLFHRLPLGPFRSLLAPGCSDSAQPARSAHRRGEHVHGWFAGPRGHRGPVRPTRRGDNGICLPLRAGGRLGGRGTATGAAAGLAWGGASGLGTGGRSRGAGGPCRAGSPRGPGHTGTRRTIG